jgi:anti-anti-sigma factor
MSSFQFKGILSAESQNDFKQMVDAAQGTHSIRLDFSKVERINSMGIALLLKALKELKQNGKAVEIVGANEMIRVSFKMMGINSWATLVDFA